MKKLFFLVAILFVNSNTTAQWITQATNFTNYRGLNEIKILDANTVWAKAYDGSKPSNNIQEFTRTIDGGKTWIPGVFNISNTEYSVNNIAPINGTTAWISAVKTTGTPTPGGIWKTTDGGVTWVQKNATAYKSDASFLNGIHFFDANNGISYGDPVGGVYENYKTSDGGETWTPLAPGATPAPESGEFGFNSLNTNVIEGNTMWIGTNKGNILRSNDMGSTWIKLESPLANFSGSTENGILKFSDINNGVILAFKESNGVSSQTLYKTSDGGNTWSDGEPFTEPYQQITYVPGTSKIIGVGTANKTYYSGYSNDNGSTWTTLINSTNADDQKFVISFKDENTGWASGFNNTSTEGIFKFDNQTLSVASFNPTSKFSVYPNATTGNIKLSSSKNTIGNVTIHSILGKEVFNAKFNNSNNEENIDLSAVNNGIYFLKATAQNGEVETIKVIKN
jgi:photosystem II stability/assembly factor-like uncharacterized protein